MIAFDVDDDCCCFFTRVDDVALCVRTGVDVTKETGKNVESADNHNRRHPRERSTTLTVLRAKLLVHRVVLNAGKKSHFIRFLKRYILSILFFFTLM